MFDILSRNLLNQSKKHGHCVEMSIFFRLLFNLYWMEQLEIENKIKSLLEIGGRNLVVVVVASVTKLHHTGRKITMRLMSRNK